MALANIRLVIFDFDGTLVDTGPDIVAATLEFLGNHTDYLPSEQEVIHAIGYGLKSLIGKAFPDWESQSARRAELEQEFMTIYERHHLNNATPFPGVREFLADWPHEVAILSNKSERFIHSLLAHLKLDRSPGWLKIAGGDTFEQPKPNALPFNRIIELTSLKKDQVLMVGDGEPDILGAHNAQLRVAAAGYGYGKRESLIELRPTWILESFRDLRALVEPSFSASGAAIDLKVQNER